MSAVEFFTLGQFFAAILVPTHTVVGRWARHAGALRVRCRPKQVQSQQACLLRAVQDGVFRVMAQQLLQLLRQPRDNVNWDVFFALSLSLLDFSDLTKL